MALEDLRQQIEAVDNRLLGALAERRALALEVARDKQQHQGAVRDLQRELTLMTLLNEKGRSLGLDPAMLGRLYQIIIEDSVLTQQAWLEQQPQSAALSIAYLGMEGTYSFLAAQGYASRRQRPFIGQACERFSDIISAVESGQADLGILPIENTSSGSINEVYDLLRHTHLAIAGETYLAVDHHLLVKPGTRLAEIKTVYGHPQALAQCSAFLNNLGHDITLQACPSSAHAMAQVSDAYSAALGPASGGELYQLEAIEHQLANQGNNTTRFIVVSRNAATVPTQLPAKTSLIMATHNQPGALVDALLVLRQHDINIIKLESRPMPGNPWEELFYIDLSCHIQSPSWQQAYAALQAMTRFSKVLGCYLDERIAPVPQP
ncbi:prephenate dehydratase domain-containing protein [Gallaecimonas sp. GXIMD1310]|uniref:prephenate dehydratase domain-containing protein n=1 Tax=Gallaecimonas sp. GXIMD1310 TaxID=3131926 RepID=UPI00325005AC